MTRPEDPIVRRPDGSPDIRHHAALARRLRRAEALRLAAAARTAARRLWPGPRAQAAAPAPRG